MVMAHSRDDAALHRVTAAANPLVPAPIMATLYGCIDILNIHVIHKKKNKAKRSDDLHDLTSIQKKSSNSFYEKVYEIVARIPKGKVTTSGAIAETIGMKSSSRLVGFALKVMPPDLYLPAQRVINRKGLLTGAHGFGGYERMRWLLEKEGIAFKGDGVDLDRHFWDPTPNKPIN